MYNYIVIKQRDIILDYIKKMELESNSSSFGLTTIEIADALDMYRSNVSAILNRMVEENILEKNGTRPLKYSIYKKRTDKDAFEALIGYDGSLKNAVQLAKASIMYPQEKLTTLIVTPEGAGSSYLVKLMYEYGLATGVIKQEERLIKVNFKHYVFDNEEMSRDGFENPGIVCLDNVDLLEQNKVAKLLELIKNKSLDNISYSDIRFVLVCNSNASPSLIKELSNITPIKIELPELAKRPKKEKLELINRFFSIESQRSRYSIEVPSNVIKALLLYENEDNVRGLNRDIKVACANAFARNYTEKKESIKLYLNDFPQRVRDGYNNLRINKDEVNNLVDEEEIYLYDGEETSKKYSNYSESSTLYEDIQKQIEVLNERGIDARVIQETLSTSITGLIGESKNRQISTEQISKLVDERIINLTRDFIELSQKTLNRSFKPSVFYGLALHLNALVFNNAKGISVPEETINDLINNNADEFGLASSLSMMLKDQFDKELTIDDLAIITSFIVGRKDSIESYPKLLYVLHGTTAEALKNVTEELCKTNNVYAYNLLLEDDINQSYEQLKQLIIDIDSSAGIIVIYDMGSIATMLNRIGNDTGIKIRSIYQPITLIGIDVARKASMEKDIDQIYNSINFEIRSNNIDDKPKAIITLCNTGEGGATILSEYIDKYSKLEYKTFPLAISDRRELFKKVDKIRQDYNIQSCVGTYNPNLYNIPFINISDVFSIRSEDLDLILQFKKPNYTNSDYEMMCDYLVESCNNLKEDDIKNTIFPFVSKVKEIYRLDAAVETGLIMHVAALVEHILAGNRIKVDIEPQMYELYEDDYKTIRKLIKELEKKWKIIISDDDVMLIVKIIRKV